MQQGGGGAGDPAQSQYATAAAHNIPVSHTVIDQLVEEASPISSRPPATTSGNLDEFMRLSAGGAADEDELADRAGGGGASGNRWPRQETLALLQIRSDMDTAFRDATVKGPLWEDVSRKLAEVGYKRSAKKCREKFENVHKYYKRTKEGRVGRQDGKSYRFFTQLEALHNTITSSATATINVVPTTSQPTATATATAIATTTLDVSPVSIGIPMPPAVSSVRMNPPSTTVGIFSAPPPPPPAAGISFSSTSNGSSSSPSSQEDEEEPFNTAAGTSRKRKRHSSSSEVGTSRMMEFFEGLMKQVMQKQEAMQQRFLDAIEKREHDRMVREEAWKRQEMARLSREHEIMAQERTISASRDAAIVSFLQKITGQTIHLPSPVTIPPVPQPQPQPVPLVAPIVTVSIQQPLHPAPPPPRPVQPAPPPQQHDKQLVQRHHHQSSISSEVAIGAVEGMAMPREIGSSGTGSLEPSSSRWPKAEVLALIKLRSGLESKYQEVGPKGPLWEEISAGMQRMGYKRNAKRCKEKWENINKYFKKVKESNKKRPEDAKTCPYFHELDALYRKKILGTTSTSGFDIQTNRPEEQQQHQESAKPDDRSEVSATLMPAQPSQLQTKNGTSTDVNTGFPGTLFGEGNGGAGNKPEDIVKEFIQLQGTPKQQEPQLTVQDYEKLEEDDDSNIDHDEDDDFEDYDDDDDDDDELREDERKMAYKIEYQRQNTSASNGGGNGAPSILAMVQ